MHWLAELDVMRRAIHAKILSDSILKLQYGVLKSILKNYYTG
jgi:hypothetical protein